MINDELRELLTHAIYGFNSTEIIDREVVAIMKLFEANRTTLLDALEKELPGGRPALENMSDSAQSYSLGFNAAIDQVKALINKYREDV